jgi:hypothetical protein
VLFIGTRFSNLYTSVDTPARGPVVLLTMVKTKGFIELLTMVKTKGFIEP